MDSLPLCLYEQSAAPQLHAQGLRLCGPGPWKVSWMLPVLCKIKTAGAGQTLSEHLVAEVSDGNLGNPAPNRLQLSLSVVNVLQ